MNVQILQNHGYYSMYINGLFYGNYDTFQEAASDLERLKTRKGGFAGWKWITGLF